MKPGDTIHFLFLLALTLALAFHLVKGLRTGRLSGGGLFYERTSQPIEFWFHFALAAAALPLVAWLLSDTLQGAERWQALPFLLLCAIGLPAAFWLVRGLQTGAARFGKSTFDRREAAPRYWAALLFHLTIAAVVILFALTWTLFERSTRLPTYRSGYGRVVTPVVEAVRDHLGAKSSPHFRYLRVDQRSGLVCGEFTLRGETRRFFGRAVDGAGQIKLESENRDFEQVHARACGGPGMVPQ
jgi:hypothetical protein